jgi:arylsulfatase
LFKGYVAQGGIQVPAVIKLPGAMTNSGTRTNRPVHVMDLMPTFLSIAHADYPDEYNGQPVVPLAGKSLLPLLSGGAETELEPREMGWSAYGMDAYRQGSWKVLRLPVPYGSGDWQLYNLASDPGEIHDISAENPERVAFLAKAWDNYAQSNGVIQPNTATAYAKPVVGRKF